MQQEKQVKATKAVEYSFSERQQALDRRERDLDTVQTQSVAEMLPSLVRLVQHPTFKDAVRTTIPTCSICLKDGAVSKHAFPCGHLCMCQKCSTGIKECPICRRSGSAKEIYY